MLVPSKARQYWKDIRLWDKTMLKTVVIINLKYHINKDQKVIKQLENRPPYLYEQQIGCPWLVSCNCCSIPQKGYQRVS
jgi:hypothetical protein